MFMFSCPWFAGSSAEGAGPWHFTGRINQTPATAHTFNRRRAAWSLRDRRRTYLLFCIQTGKRWRYCHEKSKKHLGFCCLYLLNCPDNSVISILRNCEHVLQLFTSVFRTHWHAPKVGIQKARAIQALMILWEGFGRISEFKARAVLTETVRNVTITSHLIFKTPNRLHGATDRLSQKTSKSGE